MDVLKPFIDELVRSRPVGVPASAGHTRASEVDLVAVAKRKRKQHLLVHIRPCTAINPRHSYQQQQRPTLPN